MFFHIEKEIEWRKAQGKPLGFDALRKNKPLVAIGPEHPLADDMLMADFFRMYLSCAIYQLPRLTEASDGRDGLGGISQSHPHLSPDETWKDLFAKAVKSGAPADKIIASELSSEQAMFKASNVPAAEEILRLLRENDVDSITIVAIGPLTNLALAASLDPETFLRVKEVCVMGGAVEEYGNVGPPPLLPTARMHEPPFRLIKQTPGPIRNMLNFRNQITPVAEFNTFADSIAAARVYALSSPNPKSVMPPAPPSKTGLTSSDPHPPHLAAYPEKLSRQLKCTLFPLDITHRHKLSRGQYRKIAEPLLDAGSPLAEWTTAFLASTFNKVESLQKDVSGDAVGLELHDPLTVWYCATDPSEWQLLEDEDLRVETSGQWTRGMCVIDRRTRKKRDDDKDGEIPGDSGNWLSPRNGNRLRRAIESPHTTGKVDFGQALLQRIFAI